MTETPLDDTKRALTVISLDWMRFGGSGRSEVFEWLVEVGPAPNEGGWACS